MAEKCSKGKHALIVIYTDTGFFGDAVVRWCEYCGAVVVDHETVLGQVTPGGVAPMRFPQFVREHTDPLPGGQHAT